MLTDLGGVCNLDIYLFLLLPDSWLMFNQAGFVFNVFNYFSRIMISSKVNSAKNNKHASLYIPYSFILFTESLDPEGLIDI